MKFMHRKSGEPKTSILHTVIFAAVSLAAGLLLILAPERSGLIVTRLVAGFIAVAGAAHAVLLNVRGKGILHIDNYAAGITAFAGGIFLLFRPALISGVFSVLLSIFLIYAGFGMLEYAFGFLTANAKRWWLPAVLALPLLISGFACLIDPFTTQVVKCTVLGSAFVVYALLEIVFFFIEKKEAAVFPPQTEKPAQPVVPEAPVQQPVPEAPAQQPVAVETAAEPAEAEEATEADAYGEQE